MRFCVTRKIESKILRASKAVKTMTVWNRQKFGFKALSKLVSFSQNKISTNIKINIHKTHLQKQYWSLCKCKESEKQQNHWINDKGKCTGSVTRFNQKSRDFFETAKKCFCFSCRRCGIAVRYNKEKDGYIYK